MALATYETVGNGSARSWSISFSYIHASHIKLKIDGELVDAAVSGSTVSIDDEEVSTPTSDNTVRIYRETPSSPLSNFGTTTLNDAETNRIANLQAIYLAQEYRDRLDDQTDSVERAVRAPAGEAALDELPDAETRANGVMGFDNEGQPTVVTLDGDGYPASVYVASNILPKATGAAILEEIGGAPIAGDNVWTGDNDFTGSEITVDTPASEDDSEKATNTAWVKDAIAAAVAEIEAKLPKTGDFLITTRSDSRTGWVIINDGTLSKAGAGGSTLAHADAQPLYEHLWNSFSNALCPVSTGRGASAAADFAAGKTLTMTKMLGRALVIAGAGSGLTARTLGATAGAETYAVPLKNHTHGVPTATDTATAVTSVEGAPTDTFVKAVSGTAGTSGAASAGDGVTPTMEVVQPQVHVNVFIKL